METIVKVIGAGLAGCEAAWQLSRRAARDRPDLPLLARSCRCSGADHSRSAGMAAMEGSADDLPPPYLGDPHGLHRVADRSVDVVGDTKEAEYFAVEGTRLRIMWDEGAGPSMGPKASSARLADPVVPTGDGGHGPCSAIARCCGRACAPMRG